MKKLLIAIVTLSLFIGLTACGDEPGLSKDGGAETSTVTTVVGVLETAGYELTHHDADAVTYFQENTVDELDVVATVTDLYIGYLDGGSWVEVVGVTSETEATALKAAFEADDATQLVYQSGNTIVLTYTQTTYDLFN